jgi:hypothetical protein
MIDAGVGIRGETTAQSGTRDSVGGGSRLGLLGAWDRATWGRTSHAGRVGPIPVGARGARA